MAKNINKWGINRNLVKDDKRPMSKIAGYTFCQETVILISVAGGNVSDISVCLSFSLCGQSIFLTPVYNGDWLMYFISLITE